MIDFKEVFKKNPFVSEECSSYVSNLVRHAELRIKEDIIHNPSSRGEYTTITYFPSFERCKEAYDELKKFYVDTNKTQLRIRIFDKEERANVYVAPRIVFYIRREDVE